MFKSSNFSSQNKKVLNKNSESFVRESFPQINKTNSSESDPSFNEGIIHNNFFSYINNNNEIMANTEESTLMNCQFITDVEHNTTKKTSTNELKCFLWNSRSINREKSALIKSRMEDILIINETWANIINIAAYNSFHKNRTKTRGGGVSIYVKDYLDVQIIDDSIKDTLAIKILFNTNKALFLLSSYFPPNNTLKWYKRWEKLKNLIISKCSHNLFENLIMACDWNKNLNEDEQIISQYLKIQDYSSDFSFKIGKKQSKIDFFVISQNFIKAISDTENSLSDHKIVTLSLQNFEDLRRPKTFIISKKAAKSITLNALEDSEDLLRILKNFDLIKKKCQNKRIALKPNESYKKEIQNLLKTNNFQNELIKIALDEKWNLLWAEIEKLRFSDRQKIAFDKIRKILNYSGFEKRDGSIINKVIVDEIIIIDQEKVSIYLKQSLQKLCGNQDEPTFHRQHIFPNLKELSIYEIRDLVKQLSRNKATCEDFIDDSTLFNAIETNDHIARAFTKLWSSDTMNSSLIKIHLTGRLIPLNKVHPKIPTPDEMRPIVALSPIMKLLEIRFKEKLDKYMNERMARCQSGFIKGCGTHINIVRVLERSLEYKKKIRELVYYSSTSNPLTTMYP